MGKIRKLDQIENFRQTKGIRDQKGTLTFNTNYFKNGKVDVIHEKSEFIKENGVWMYLGIAK